MKNIMCHPTNLNGLTAMQQPSWATFGTFEPSSIRKSEINYDARMPGSFIEGDGYA